MRILTIAVLSLTLAAIPALAQNASAPSGRVFSSRTCPQRVGCPDTAPMMTSEYVASASACLKQSFGVDLSSVFDDTSMDNENCLRIRPEATSDPKAMVPKCCVVELPDNTCTFNCAYIAGAR